MANFFKQYASGALTAATAIWSDAPPDAICAILQAEGQNVRIRFDGTIPTAASGHLLIVGAAPFRVYGASLVSQLRAIEAAVGGILNVHFLNVANEK